MQKQVTRPAIHIGTKPETANRIPQVHTPKSNMGAGTVTATPTRKMATPAGEMDRLFGLWDRL
ncbi:hypothetical protein D3C78_1851970 [compost metagenome]